MDKSNLNYQHFPVYETGNKIKIKDKNKGSFTRYCKGKVTEECIRKGKNSNNPKIRKKAIFALNARVWKHLHGGPATMSIIDNDNRDRRMLEVYNIIHDKYAPLFKRVKNSEEFISLLGLRDLELNELFEKSYVADDGNVYFANVKPAIVEGYRPIKLKTYYPLQDSGNLIGHSSLRRGLKGISVRMNDNNYNLITDNCSDSTRRILEHTFGDKSNNFLFTTPGDVKDYALKHGGYDKNGYTYIPVNKQLARAFDEALENEMLYRNPLLKRNKILKYLKGNKFDEDIKIVWNLNNYDNNLV